MVPGIFSQDSFSVFREQRGVGATGYAAGLAASALLDLPSGAVVVWALALVGIVAWAFAANGRRTRK